METQKLQIDFSGFRNGQSVFHMGRGAHVVAIPPSMVPEGSVPIMYDNESSCYIIVLTTEIERRY